MLARFRNNAPFTQLVSNTRSNSGNILQSQNERFENGHFAVLKKYNF